MFSMQLPTLIVCLAACIVILSKRGAASRATLWALMGFGLVLLLCIVMPVMHTLVQGWVFQSGHNSDRIWAFTAVSIVWSVLHAGAYVFLLLAILAGRTKPESANLPVPPSPL